MKTLFFIISIINTALILSFCESSLKIVFLLIISQLVNYFVYKKVKALE